MDFSSQFQRPHHTAPAVASRRSVVLSKRLRRLLAAACVALVVAVAYLGMRDVLTSSWVPAYRFTTQLAAGTVLTAEHLESIRLPPAVAPPDTVPDAATLVGTPLTRRVSTGDFVTSHHLAQPGRAWTPTPTSRLISIPATAEVPDAAIGATVDLVSAADAAVLGTGVIVGLPTAAQQSGLLNSPATPSRVVVSVDVTIVGKVARALASTGGISLAVHPATPPR